MDYMDYRLTWRKEEEVDRLPEIRLPVAAMQWDLRWGGHPSLLKIDPVFYERSPFVDTQNSAISPEFQIRPMGCTHGHNTMADIGYTSLVDVDINVPTSPLFVRDLCGRTIYIGYGPLQKGLSEWEAYDADQQLEKDGEVIYPNDFYPGITFPRYCREVPEDLENADLIEQVFFCKFRTLDMSFDFAAKPSGGGDEYSAGIYTNANLFPYKLRLDTFYIDGYKLPQTHMVFARQDVLPHEARKAVERLEQAWSNRPQSASYDAFVEGLGDDGVERLYEEGCTLIPTFEACNGVHKVSRDFELLDYWAGRAVLGLHEIVEMREDSAPPGTILAVLEPGYVTAWDVKPAKVVVSDGALYMSENAEDPEPLLPNLHLPHQRVSAEWGATWVPTHPEHFEIPAIWGWDGQTGLFMQLSGPLWDPLHYYYACTDLIAEAFNTPMEKNRWLVEVPSEMENRFYPVVPMKGFDTIDFGARIHRYQERLLPRSAVKRVKKVQESAPVGYHPMPPQFEYELDPFWFPELHPFNRDLKVCPEDLEDRMALVISSGLTPQQYLDTVHAPDESEWMLDANFLTPSQGEPLIDYPFLARYVDEDLPSEEIFAMSAGLFLEDVPEVFLTGTPQKIWPGVDDIEDLEELVPGMFDAVWDMREDALRLLRLRHRLYRQNPGLYAYAWWLCIGAHDLEAFFTEWEEALKARKAGPDRTKIPLGSQVMPVTLGDVEEDDEPVPMPLMGDEPEQGVR